MQLAEARLAELDEAIALAGGVTVQALSDKPAVTPGGTFKVTLTALARNPAAVTLRGVKLSGIEGVPQPTIASDGAGVQQAHRISGEHQGP